MQKATATKRLSTGEWYVTVRSFWKGMYWAVSVCFQTKENYHLQVVLSLIPFALLPLGNSCHWLSNILWYLV